MFFFIGFLIIRESGDYKEQVGNNYIVPMFNPDMDNYIKHFLISLFLFNACPTLVNVYSTSNNKSAKELYNITVVGNMLCVIFYLIIGIFGMISMVQETPQIL